VTSLVALCDTFTVIAVKVGAMMLVVSQSDVIVIVNE
jgi:hypothetical protein